MRLKTFQAKSMNEALRQIKDALGDDAIIVSSREEDGFVRITAAVEHLPVAHEAEKPKEFQVQESKQQKSAVAAAYDEDTVLEMITDALLKHRVPGSVSDKIIAAASILNNNDPHQTLAKALDKTLFILPQKKERKKPLILVGPPGAGKTLMTAKLAAQAVMEGQKPAVITTDIARAGGVEQLSAFLNILELPLYQAEDMKSLQSVMMQARNAPSVIIDTGGLNPFDPQEMKTLAKLMTVADMEAALVLPAGIDAEESAEIALTFGVLGVKKLIPTRLDFARRLGGILSAADRAGLSLCEASHTPQVANGITLLNGEKLSKILMPRVAAATEGKRGKA